MIQPFPRKLGGARFAAPLALASVFALALALAGCGRRGPLELPPTAPQASQTSSATPSRSAVSLDAAATNVPATAQTTETKPATSNQPPPRYQSFFLDPLVK